MAIAVLVVVALAWVLIGAYLATTGFKGEAQPLTPPQRGMQLVIVLTWPFIAAMLLFILLLTWDLLPLLKEVPQQDTEAPNTPE